MLTISRYSDTAPDSHLFASLSQASKYLQSRQSIATSDSKDASPMSRAFLIGGAQLYNLFLRQPSVDGFTLERLLVTRIRSPSFDDCDTFLDEFRDEEQIKADAADSASSSSTQGIQRRWKKASHDEMLAWLGDAITEELKQSFIQEEGVVKYEMQMWSRDPEVAEKEEA